MWEFLASIGMMALFLGFLVWILVRHNEETERGEEFLPIWKKETTITIQMEGTPGK